MRTDRNCSGVFQGRGDGGAHAGVVEEDVDPAECLNGLIDEPPAILRAPHVGLHGERAPPGGFDKLAGVGKPVDSTGTECDVGARLGECLRGGHTQS